MRKCYGDFAWKKKYQSRRQYMNDFYMRLEQEYLFDGKYSNRVPTVN